MKYINYYNSPLGRILLASDGVNLTGLWFVGQRYYACGLSLPAHDKNLPVFKDVIRWLNIYFSGQKPEYTPPVHFIGTSFQIDVWKIIEQIPYGEIVTYKDIAAIVARQKGQSQMSAQAIGGAVAHNKISIIVPCHRVFGMNKKLTGYAGGLDRKSALLKLEQAMII